MAYYFDPDVAADLLLLKSDVRTNSELSNVANATENKIRNMYTEYSEVTEEYTVKLRGYLSTADPDDTYPLFKQAYKQTIADCISYILRNYDNGDGLKREKRGQREWEWFEGIDFNSLPMSLFAKLELFDTRVPLY